MKINLQFSGLKKALVVLLVTASAVGSGIAAYYNSQSEPTAITKASIETGTVIYENSFATQADFDKCTVVQGPGNPVKDQWKYYK